MKKWKAILLILTLTACAVCAGAEGLPSLNPLPSISLLAPLPDPGVSLGQAGQLYQADFAYENGTTYDTYLYARPNPAEAFIAAYTDAVGQAGYTVEEGTESGNKALYISDGTEKAILLPDYQGYMFFMVPKGFDFVPETAVEPTPAPEVKYNYMRMEYNGQYFESEGSIDGAEYKFGGYKQIFKFNNAPFMYISFAWPGAAKVGSTYTVLARDGYDKYSVDNSINISVHGVTDWINGNVVGTKLRDSSGIDDYFTLKITKIENTKYGKLIEGTFECQLGTKGDDPVIIRNGFFSVFAE